MTQIHPTSVIDAKADLADDVEVGPFCYIGSEVVIGAGTRLVNHVSIHGPTTIGKKNIFWPFVTLGGDPQDLKYHGERTELIIGDHNDLRECVSVHRGTDNDKGVTKVGSHNLIMAYTHIAHDCAIGDHVIMANGVGLAGHIHVQDHAAIGGQTGVHHFVTIGQYAYVGGMTRIVHDVPPYMLVEGTPAKVRGVNVIGLARHSFNDQSVDHIKNAYKILFKGAAEGKGVGRMTESLAKIEQQYPDDQYITSLVGFVRNSSNSVFGRYREGLRRDDRRKTRTQ